MITSSRQSKHSYALVYGVHRAIYITVVSLQKGYDSVK